jgi:hypothetical protein
MYKNQKSGECYEGKSKEINGALGARGREKPRRCVLGYVEGEWLSESGLIESFEKRGL